MKQRLSFDARMAKLREALQPECKRKLCSKFDLDYALCSTYTATITDHEWINETRRMLDLDKPEYSRTG